VEHDRQPGHRPGHADPGRGHVLGRQVGEVTIEARQPWAVELLYADHEGGQRAISRFLALPVEHQSPAGPGDHPDQAAVTRPGWLASASRHWNLDRPDGR
jgi:hypothetical protein